MTPDTNKEDGDNPRKEAALELAGRGFSVLAVDKRTKRPDKLLAPNGYTDATRDAETIAGWWDVKPEANIGIACGPDYDLVVLDVDCKNGSPGLETFNRLGVAPLTLTASTPSGGMHLYFRHPKARLFPTLPGIDIKGADGGGYVVAPPSLLPEGSYTWGDLDMPVAEFPAELLRQLRVDEKATRGRKKLKAITPRPPADPGAGPVATLRVKEGTRHPRLIELGGVFRGKGLEEDEIEALLWLHAERYFDPPFSRDDPAHAKEIEDVVRWYATKQPNTEGIEPLTILSTRRLRELAKVEPSRPLIEPLLPEAGALMIYGGPGIGKSHMGVRLAGALAQGRSFLDWAIPAAVEVLFVDGEMPLDELDIRIASYFGDDPLERLSWVAARARETDLPNLADPAGQELYFAAVTAVAARVVVFDNLSCLRLTSADSPENSLEAWLPVASFIRRLNRRGVAVILIHHAAKSGGQRGSTAHVAPMDTVLCMRELGEGQADPRAVNDVELVFEKHRRFGGQDALPIRAKAFEDPDGRVTWERVGSDPLADDAARLRLQGVSIREIAKRLQRSRSAIQKALDRAKARGLLPLAEGASP